MSTALAKLSADAARTLTDEVKADAAVLWQKLLGLYEGEAHLALGYPSWGAYYEAEFGGSGRRGYQLLEAARVVDALEPVNHGSTTPPERVARELAPLRHEPERVAEAWAETVEQHGPEPTAAQVREVVRKKRPGEDADREAIYGRDALYGLQLVLTTVDKLRDYWRSDKHPFEGAEQELAERLRQAIDLLQKALNAVEKKGVTQ